MQYTVEVRAGDEQGEVFATYLRDGEKIALALWHGNIADEISRWIMEGKIPANGTFYKW